MPACVCERAKPANGSSEKLFGYPPYFVASFLDAAGPCFLCLLFKTHTARGAQSGQKKKGTEAHTPQHAVVHMWSQTDPNFFAHCSPFMDDAISR